MDTSFGLSQFHGHGSWLVTEVAQRAGSHGVPSQSVHSQPLRVWKLGLTTSHATQALSPKYGMDAYMSTFFEGEA